MHCWTYFSELVSKLRIQQSLVTVSLSTRIQQILRFRKRTTCCLKEDEVSCKLMKNWEISLLGSDLVAILSENVKVKSEKKVKKI
jgi:hypothetical protein